MNEEMKPFTFCWEGWEYHGIVDGDPWFILAEVLNLACRSLVPLEAEVDVMGWVARIDHDYIRVGEIPNPDGDLKLEFLVHLHGFYELAELFHKSSNEAWGWVDSITASAIDSVWN